MSAERWEDVSSPENVAPTRTTSVKLTLSPRAQTDPEARATLARLVAGGRASDRGESAAEFARGLVIEPGTIEYQITYTIHFYADKPIEDAGETIQRILHARDEGLATVVMDDPHGERLKGEITRIERFLEALRSLVRIA